MYCNFYYSIIWAENVQKFEVNLKNEFVQLMHEEAAAEMKFREFSKHASVSMHPQSDEIAKLKNEIEEFKAQKQHMQEMERLMNELKSLKNAYLEQNEVRV